MHIKSKTLFVDIDGTLIYHQNLNLSDQCNVKVLLNGTLEKFTEWDQKGYNIILTTGRRESMRKKTQEQLTELGLFWDQLIMGIGGGDRVIINDKKPNSDRSTSYAINLTRNKGIQDVEI